MHRHRERVGTIGIAEDRGVARDFGQRRRVRRDDRTARRHGLEHRQPEALDDRREHERAGAVEQPHDLRLRDRSREGDAVVDAQPAGKAPEVAG